MPRGLEAKTAAPARDDHRLSSVVGGGILLCRELLDERSERVPRAKRGTTDRLS